MFSELLLDPHLWEKNRKKKEKKKKCTDKEKLNDHKVKNLLTGNKVPLLNQYA